MGYRKEAHPPLERFVHPGATIKGEETTDHSRAPCTPPRTFQSHSADSGNTPDPLLAGVNETTTTRATEIQKSRSGSLTFFCRDRLAALEAEDVPALVKSTLVRWTVNDRPFGVTVGPDDDPKYEGELNDLYFFEVPRGAPRWWVEACEAWDDTDPTRRRHRRRPTAPGGCDVSSLTSSQRGRETASIEALTGTLYEVFGAVTVTAAGAVHGRPLEGPASGAR